MPAGVTGVTDFGRRFAETEDALGTAWVEQGHGDGKISPRSVTTDVTVAMSASSSCEVAVPRPETIVPSYLYPFVRAHGSKVGRETRSLELTAIDAGRRAVICVSASKPDETARAES
jgi:hypothetical protein